MPTDVDRARHLVRAHPLRTGLLVGLPLAIAAIEGYLSLTDHHHHHHHTAVGLGFAALLLAYSAGVTRLHLARHRIDRLEAGGDSAGSAPHPSERH